MNMEKIKSSIKKDGNEIRIRDLSKDKKRKRSFVTFGNNAFVILLTLLFIMSLFSPVVLAEGDESDDDEMDEVEDDEADDKDDDGVDDDLEDLNERGLHVEIEPGRVEIESVLVNSDGLDEIELEFRAEDGIKVEMELSKHHNTVEPELEISVEFREIIEFVDENGDGYYDDSDVEISVYDLREAEYSEITYITQETVDNETEHVVSAQTTDGVFKVVLHAVGDFAKIESGTIAPSEVKIDLLINNYPYEGNNTQLALMSKLEAEAEYESEEEFEEEHGEEGEDHLSEEEDEHEEKIILSSSEALGYFSWADTAEVDGVTTPVKTIIKNETEGVKIFFAYARGTSINHDPKLGVPYLTLSSGTTETTTDLGMRLVPYLGALVVGAVIIGLAVSWRRKKNGQI
jgi:hypothetical protein